MLYPVPLYNLNTYMQTSVILTTWRIKKKTLNIFQIQFLQQMKKEYPILIITLRTRIILFRQKVYLKIDQKQEAEKTTKFIHRALMCASWM